MARSFTYPEGSMARLLAYRDGSMARLLAYRDGSMARSFAYRDSSTARSLKITATRSLNIMATPLAPIATPLASIEAPLAPLTNSDTRKVTKKLICTNKNPPMIEAPPRKAMTPLAIIVQKSVWTSKPLYTESTSLSPLRAQAFPH